MDQDTLFNEIYSFSRKFTMTSKEKMYALYKAVEYVIKHNLPGDFVECGCWRGGSVMLMAMTALRLSVTDRKIYLYDTFNGMPEPSEIDYCLGNKKIQGLRLWKKNQRKEFNQYCYASLDEVKRNLLLTGYPNSNFLFVQGKTQDTIPQVKPSSISLLRLDTDWYESTKCELSYLYPLLVNAGVIILDDYGYWAGSKKAVDEYFLNKRILLNRINSSGRIAIKIAEYND